MEKERQAAVDRAEEWMTGREPPKERVIETSSNVRYVAGMRLEIDGEVYIVGSVSGTQVTIIEAPEG
jgi:hypothetical protein